MDTTIMENQQKKIEWRMHIKLLLILKSCMPLVYHNTIMPKV